LEQVLDGLENKLLFGEREKNKSSGGDWNAVPYPLVERFSLEKKE